MRTVSHDGSPAPLTINADVRAILTWEHEKADSAFTHLHENAGRYSWNAHTDIDWFIPVNFGGPLPDRSEYMLGAFQASPLGGRDRRSWDSFRWETQAWMICQFLYGEQAAMLASARLAEVLPGIGAKLCAVSQASDEARHVQVLARYVSNHVPSPYQLAPGLRRIFQDALGAAQWDLLALAMQCLVEPLALASFRMAKATFHDDLIRQIADRIAGDEARHVSFGVLLLRDVVPALSAAELTDREDFLLTAVDLMSRRFLLDEVWERFQVPARDGIAFALADPAMAAYRQTLFSRVIKMLASIGLLTPRVVSGLEMMNLLSASGQRTINRVRSPA